MKNILHAFPNLFLITVLAANYSCSGNHGDEISVSDFGTLSSMFSNPPAGYSTAPFFVWNGEITRSETDKFLEEFHNQGIRQVIIHPRPGLITEYLSEEWFEQFRYTVERCRDMGMKVWIYDENSYPSGFAGGHVPSVMPESFNQGQGLKMMRTKSLPDTADKFFLVLKEENGSFADITGNLKAEAGKSGNYCLFSKTCYGKSEWYGGFSYVDLLYPGVTGKFLEVTMKGYEESAGEEFGKTVSGIFTDEPHINTPGGIRYTPDLFDVFQKMWNYDLKKNLPSLFEETGDWKKVRHNYAYTLLELFNERWAKPYSRYCENKGLKFTGHYWEHEWPGMRNGGDNMAMYVHFHVPGIDMLFNQWNESSPGAQFGNVRSVKELSSAANQAGRNRKLSETYGGSGWDLTFTEMKRNGDWEYALGVNLMNQHLTFYTMAGARKYDYPPTFDYHQPWWNNYKLLADHYSRLSLALSAGNQKNEILVIEPTTTAWMYDSYNKANPYLNKVGQSFQTFITNLEKQQVEYDLGSEKIISDMGSVKDWRFVVGKCSYKTVVIPPCTENLNETTFKLLRKFAVRGGKIIMFSKPVFINGSESPELNEFLSSNSGNNISADTLSDEITGKWLSNRDVKFNITVGGGLFHHTRVLKDGILVFLTNASLTDTCKGELTVPGRAVVTLNSFDGEIKGFPHERNGEEIKAGFILYPAESLLLFFPEKETLNYTYDSDKSAPASLVQPTGEVSVKRDEPNALMIDFCDLEIEGIKYDNLHVYDAADKVFKHYGFKTGNPWNHSVQYRRKTVEKDTFGIKTGFSATYKFYCRNPGRISDFTAVTERPGLWKVRMNGKEIAPVPGMWWLDRSFGVFDISGMVREGLNEITITASPMSVHAEIEPVYIRGDFSLEPHEKGWLLTPPEKEITTGSWKDQGMPFYSWSVTYSKEYDIDTPSGEYFIQAPGWSGTLAEVFVNSKKAGVTAFPPYRLNITRFVSPGKNTVELKVTGSLRNLLGPHHNTPPEGISSPWSWRNVKEYPSGKDYKFYDYGLMKDFVLTNTF